MVGAFCSVYALAILCCVLLLPYDLLMAADFVGIDLAESLITRNGVQALGSAAVSWLEVKPSSVDDLSAALRLSSQPNSQEYAFFPGLLDAGALKENRQNVFIDFSALARVREHVPSDLVIACETGITIGQLNKYLSALGQRFPVDLGDNANQVALVDLLLTGDGGYLETGFGYLRSQVLGLESVYAGGLVLKSGGRVVKNVTGFDVTKLVIGSRGAFAFPYLAYLRLAAIPEAVSSFSAKSKSNDSSELLAVSARLLASGLPLCALEIVEVESKENGNESTEYQLIVQVEGPSQLVADLSAQIEDTLAAFKFEKLDNLVARKILTYSLASAADYCVEAAASLSLLQALLENLSNKQSGKLRGKLRIRPACGRLYLHSASKEQVDRDLELLSGILRTCRQRADGSALAGWESLTVAARCGLFTSSSQRLTAIEPAAKALYKRIKEKFDPNLCLNPQANFTG